MTKHKWHEEEITKTLKSMPVIKDSRDKDILYQRISLHLQNENEDSLRRKKSPRLLPVLGSIIAVLLVVLIPFVLNDASFQTSEEQNIYGTQSAEDSAIQQESSSQEESIQKLEASEEQEESNLPPKENILQQADHNQLVLNSKEDNVNVIYGAISDEQLQYVIPITFIVPNSENLNDHYNKVEKYLRERNLTTENYLLKDMSYNIQNTNHEVQINVPEDFSIDSSARAYMFEQLIEAMFVPVGIEKATFSSESKEGIELGPYGVIKEMTLGDVDKVSYKLYNDQFLVPIPHEGESTVIDAISEMKKSQEQFNLVQTIPSQIQFSIESSENELLLTYNGKTELENSQQFITMIEAILMTAKSYGFDFVRFQNMPLEQIGNYRFDESLKVPEAVNPYDINE